MFFGISNAVGGSWTGPTWMCGFSIWVLQFTLEFSSFLIFCIALNLLLVVGYRFNGQRLEKYYIYGSLILALAITIPPYAAAQYGWDILVGDCWYSDDVAKVRLGWQIGTQLVWQMLTVTGEIVCAVVVIWFMTAHRRNYAKNIESQSQSSAQKRQVGYALTYRNIIARIGLYPFASMVLNLTSVACVIRATVHDGVHDWTGYRVLLLSDFLYGGRAVLYACLAATDPSFIVAMKALLAAMFGWKFDNKDKNDTELSASQTTNANGVKVEFTTVRYGDEDDHKMDDLGDIDMHAYKNDFDSHHPDATTLSALAVRERQIQQHLERSRGRDTFKKNI
jgi:hypothetical protein